VQVSWKGVCARANQKRNSEGEAFTFGFHVFVIMIVAAMVPVLTTAALH
jgi:hypothetical protein